MLDVLSFAPMRLDRKPAAFDHPDWLFELKYDGFRAIAVVEYGNCTLYSRNGHQFSAFSDLAIRIGNSLMPRSLTIDGEIVCFDKHGRTEFNELLFHRGTPHFVAFDLLQLSGRDLRPERLVDRKQELRRILGTGSPLMFADHIEASGVELFKRACDLDLEGIVAKRKDAPYSPEETTWYKMRNQSYSQWAGRQELFEHERDQVPAPGWHSCTLAAAEAV